MKKGGLGKGLSALIPQQEIFKNSYDESINKVSIKKIKANKGQPRKNFDNEKIKELSASILEHGIIQPLVLKRDKNNTYQIIAGERRYRAAKLAQIEELPAVIMDLNDKEMLEISLIENIQREDLNPIEEAEAYKRLLEDFKLTQDELSKRMSKSRTSMTNTMRLLNLDSRVKEYLIEGIISSGHGKALLGIEDKDKQYELCQLIIDKNLSVREIEKIVKNIKEEITEEKIPKERDSYIVDMELRLENLFNTKVNIHNKKGNKGKIEIEYYSLEDLDRLLEVIKENGK